MSVLRVPLRGRGGAIRGVALLDTADALRIGTRGWRLATNGYVIRHVYIEGRRTTESMHRCVLALAPGGHLETDHINRDRLDNRRANLRVVTHAQNLQNRPAHGGSSAYRGVSWAADHGSWRVQVIVGGVKHHVGYFADELSAARAAEAFRQEHMPFAQPDPLLTESEREAA